MMRPECVVATRRGDVFVSDALGAIAWFTPGEASSLQRLVSQLPEEFLCNGFSMLENGEFLIANLGNAGGIWKLVRNRDGRGELQPWLMEVDGVAMPPSNYVSVKNGAGTVAWASVSTTKVPREQSFKSATADGFIVRIEDAGGTVRAQVVADGLGFTNEHHVHPNGEWMYVNETIARRMSRFRLRADGSLGPRETVVEFGDGIWPDGFEFDAEGGIWVASVVSNRLLRIAPDGDVITILDEGDPDAVALAEENFARDAFSRNDIDAGRLGRLGNLASVNFGGPDLRTVYLGSLFNDHLTSFSSNIAGATPHHFDYENPWT